MKPPASPHFSVCSISAQRSWQLTCRILSQGRWSRPNTPPPSWARPRSLPPLPQASSCSGRHLTLPHRPGPTSACGHGCDPGATLKDNQGAWLNPRRVPAVDQSAFVPLARLLHPVRRRNSTLLLLPTILDTSLSLLLEALPAPHWELTPGPIRATPQKPQKVPRYPST